MSSSLASRARPLIWRLRFCRSPSPSHSQTPRFAKVSRGRLPKIACGSGPKTAWGRLLRTTNTKSTKFAFDNFQNFDGSFFENQNRIKRSLSLIVQIGTPVRQIVCIILLRSKVLWKERIVALICKLDKMAHANGPQKSPFCLFCNCNCANETSLEFARQRQDNQRVQIQWTHQSQIFFFWIDPRRTRQDKVFASKVLHDAHLKELFHRRCFWILFANTCLVCLIAITWIFQQKISLCLKDNIQKRLILKGISKGFEHLQIFRGPLLSRGSFARRTFFLIAKVRNSNPDEEFFDGLGSRIRDGRTRGCPQIKMNLKLKRPQSPVKLNTF